MEQVTRDSLCTFYYFIIAQVDFTQNLSELFEFKKDFALNLQKNDKIGLVQGKFDCITSESHHQNYIIINRSEFETIKNNRRLDWEILRNNFNDITDEVVIIDNEYDIKYHSVPHENDTLKSLLDIGQTYLIYKDVRQVLKERLKTNFNLLKMKYVVNEKDPKLNGFFRENVRFKNLLERTHCIYNIQTFYGVKDTKHL